MNIKKKNTDSKRNSKLMILKSYFELCKPNVMYLSILSAIAGMFLAPGNITFTKFFLAIIFISMGAGSAGAFNMYFEMEIDSLMDRTSKRPLPSWKIKRHNALYFASSMAFISVIFMALAINLLSAFLLFLTIVFYAYFYTLLLKKNTIHNVVIGGIPGAMPPLIGWAAVQNSLSLSIFSLFLIIFFWIPPHSWALALFKINEYKKVKIPMLPVIKGRSHTINQILIYSIFLIITSYLPYFFKIISVWYVFIVTILNVYFLYFVLKLYIDKKDLHKNKHEKKLFFFSISYLFAILIWIICEKILMKFLA